MDDTKILVIEDDHNITRFLKVSLETNHYKVLLAEKGIEGISLFLCDNPDLILLDLGLPVIDGTEVLCPRSVHKVMCQFLLLVPEDRKKKK